jgi:glutamine cyclotransferase
MFPAKPTMPELILTYPYDFHRFFDGLNSHDILVFPGTKISNLAAGWSIWKFVLMP